MWRAAEEQILLGTDYIWDQGDLCPGKGGFHRLEAPLNNSFTHDYSESWICVLEGPQTSDTNIGRLGSKF